MAEVELRLVPLGRRGILASAERLARLKSQKAFPATAAAVGKLTGEAQRVMLRAVQGRFVSWSGGTFKVNRLTGKLAGAILGGYRHPYEGNPLRGALVINHPHYRFIRDGVSPYDMKPGLLASAKARSTYSPRLRKHIRWLVVPIKVDPNTLKGPVEFRTVTSESKGWLHPGTLPRRLDLYTQEKMRDKVRRQLRAALVADLGGAL